MHHPTDRIAHTTAFVTPVVEHWLEREIAQWVDPMKDRSDDPSHHEQTLLPRSYISLLILVRINKKKSQHKMTKPYNYCLLISHYRMVTYSLSQTQNISRLARCHYTVSELHSVNHWFQFPIAYILTFTCLVVDTIIIFPKNIYYWKHYFFPISSNGSFICSIPQTGWQTAWPLHYQVPVTM